MLISYKGLIEKYNILPKGVLHIGANVGQEAPDYYTHGVIKTVWVEADPGLIMNLIGNLQPYSNHLIFNDCLTDKDGEEVTFHVANNFGQSSSILELGTHKDVHKEVHYVQDRTLRTKRLDTLFKEANLNIEDYSFVNIDIQGAEGLCLQGFGDLLYRVKYLYVEVNDNELYLNCMLYPQLKEYLSNFGFVVKEKVMSGNTGWGDCFMINENI